MVEPEWRSSNFFKFPLSKRKSTYKLILGILHKSCEFQEQVKFVIEAVQLLRTIG